MSKKETLRKLGVVRAGTASGTYTNAKDRPTELQMDGVFDAEKDLVRSDESTKDTGKPANQNKSGDNGTSPLAIIGFVLALIIFVPFLPIAALIVSILGLRQAKKRQQKGSGLAIAGIVISIIVGLLHTLILIGIIAGSNNVTLVTYRDPTSGFSVKHPDDWSVQPEQVEGAKGVIIKKEYKETGKVYGQIEVVYIAPPANGYNQDVLKAIADKLKQDVKNPTVQYEGRTTKNGLETATVVMTYDGENGRIKQKTTVILKKDNGIYTVVTQTPEENWEKYQDSFDEIHNTFIPG
jgi:protein-disulfide isomerase